jgi:hypothetical protein
VGLGTNQRRQFANNVLQLPSHSAPPPPAAEDVTGPYPADHDDDVVGPYPAGGDDDVTGPYPEIEEGELVSGPYPRVC